jgi:transcriptional regulator with XRE-family HTH domain
MRKADTAVISQIYFAIMLLLADVAQEIAKHRKAVGLSRAELAKRALVSRSTLDALENGRSGELGYAKLNRILTALDQEFKLQELNHSRPTLDELMIENDREDALLRRSKAGKI